jgi:hypothetical protein
MLGCSRVAAQLAASQEGLSSMSEREVEATNLEANPEEKGALDEQQEVPLRLQ